MVSPWWGLGLAAPLVAIKAVSRRGQKSRGNQESTYVYRSFICIYHVCVCVRVCVSKARGDIDKDLPAAVSVCECSVEEGTEPNFICERVCTSNKLMRRMGGLAKV